MFDFAWSEIALIGIVALIFIGPKDLPIALKAVSEVVKKARRMASEFQTHVDEMMRDADLKDVRDTFNDLKRMDIKGKILEAVDSDRSIRNTINDNPFDIHHTPPPIPETTAPETTPAAEPVIQGDIAVEERPETVLDASAEPDAPPAPPPSFLPPRIAASGVPGPKPRPPSFLPPHVVAAAEAARRVSPYG